jgi:hypothetical protein
MGSVDKSPISELQGDIERNVFIMMRYRSTEQFKQIEDSLRSSLAKYGLVGRLAKDRAYSDDLWENIEIYMKYSKYGIAVFEEIDEKEFNPNVSLELGYMYAIKRRCLLLKERSISRLPTDACGKLYRDFDCERIAETITREVAEWCVRDLCLSPVVSDECKGTNKYRLVYDSQTDDADYRQWGHYSTLGFASAVHLGLLREVQIEGDMPGGYQALELRTEGTENVGFNKMMEFLVGKVRLSYQARTCWKPHMNLQICIIPMQSHQIGRLLEVGTDHKNDPDNGFSPYREKRFIPHQHVGDGKWHEMEITFDFRETQDATYSILALRINEGCTKPGPGNFLVRNVRLFELVG